MSTAYNHDLNPLVSIVMPSYNQGGYIEAAIQSVLSQDYRPLELIVIDGHSSDQTLWILEAYNDVAEVRWYSRPDSGVVEAVNKGLAIARGAILGIQSSDDLYMDTAVVRTAVEALIVHKADIVYGNSRKESESGQSLHESAFKPYSLENFLLLKTRFPQESTFFRSSVLHGAKGWREEVAYAADTDFFWRIALTSRVHFIDQVLGRRVMHEGQRYEKKSEIARDYGKMIDLLIGEAGFDQKTVVLGEISKLLVNKRYLWRESKVKCLWALWKVDRYSRQIGIKSPESLWQYVGSMFQFHRLRNLWRQTAKRAIGRC